MPTIFVKDEMRAAVEAASGGKQTVLYTASGQPSVMNVIPSFNLEDIDASLGVGVHPAFVVGGAQKGELFIGAYQGIVKNGELISLPGVDPSVSRNHDGFVTAARANGAGWHVMSNVEYAAIALWCWKNGFMPRGNTGYGRSSDATHETARRTDGAAAGLTTGSPRTLTGSGPASWRHDNTPGGISDICGNIWEWSPGMRVVQGEIQVIANNDAALNATDLGATSAAWKAIDGATGLLINPTFTGTIAGGDYVPTTPKSVRYAVSGAENYTLVRASGQSFEGVTNPGATPASDAALSVLKGYGIYPPANVGLGGDGLYMNAQGERIAVRGGVWSHGVNAGIFTISIGLQRSQVNADLGSRPAFLI